MGKLVSTTVYAYYQIYLNPFSRIKLGKDLAEILLAYRAVLNSFGKLSWVETGLTVFKI